jgi:protein-L-isoaspartate(D-aspartate) O-methyltransferase
VLDILNARGIRNPDILRAMQITPRHEFLPAEVRDLAYEDRAVPIGYGATISQPFIVALMTQILEPEPWHRVLEIGTGSGYQAAILAQLVSHVYSVELVPELALSATKTLARLGYRNVTVRQGDGYEGWPELAPFDRIILTAAPPEIPEALIEQLANGCRLVAPVGSSPDQDLILLTKDESGNIHGKFAGGVSFIPMRRDY